MVLVAAAAVVVVVVVVVAAFVVDDVVVVVFVVVKITCTSLGSVLLRLQLKIMVASLRFNFPSKEDIAEHDLSLKAQIKFMLCRCEGLEFMDRKFNFVKRKPV